MVAVADAGGGRRWLHACVSGFCEAITTSSPAARGGRLKGGVSNSSEGGCVMENDMVTFCTNAPLTFKSVLLQL